MPSRPLTTLFRALSDPTRRAVIERLAAGDAAVSELAHPFDMTLPSFMQHLDILEKSGVVSSRKVSRQRIFSLNPEKLEVIDHWLEWQRRIWRIREARMEAANDGSPGDEWPIARVVD